jgi:hypothetical protein
MIILILPVLALLLAPSLPRWGVMWAMAGALYATGKWLSYRSVSARVPTANRPLALGYLLVWPGMNAKAFLLRRRPRAPVAVERRDQRGGPDHHGGGDDQRLRAAGSGLHGNDPVSHRHYQPPSGALIAHDRAGFGGALVSFGVAMFGCVRYARPSRALFQTLTLAGVAGFSTAVGVHPAIGYVSFTHLAPAVLGCVVFAAGLAFAIRGSRA